MAISEPELRALTPLQRTQWVRGPLVTGIDAALAAKVCPLCGLFDDEQQPAPGGHVCAPEQEHEKAHRYGGSVARCKNGENAIILHESAAKKIAEYRSYLNSPEAPATFLRVVDRAGDDLVIFPLRILP